MTFTPPPRSTVFRFLIFSPCTVSGSFCVLGSGFFYLGCFWCFLRLVISVFLLQWFWCFLNLKVRVWGVPCLTGLGSLVPALLFFWRPTDSPRSVLGRGGPCCLFAFFFLRPADPLHSVLGQGLGNRATKLRHGTVGFSCSFLLSSCRRPPQLRAGGRPGQSGYSWCGTGLYVLSSFFCDARYFVLSLLCVFS